jgi:hypothetical protein
MYFLQRKRSRETIEHNNMMKIKKISIVFCMAMGFALPTWSNNENEEMSTCIEVLSESQPVNDIEMGNPLKKRMKEWQKIDEKDMDALSTEQARELKDYLERAGNKQMKRGRILFWTGLAWPVVGGVVGGVSKSGVVAGICAGLGIGQMAWGYMDMIGGREKLDNSRLVIVSVPVQKTTISNDISAQLGMGVMQDQLSHGISIGPAITFSF